MATVTGNTYGLQKIEYQDINVLRSDLFATDMFVNLIRNPIGLEVIFENLMPITVKKGTIESILGCGKLADPQCLTSYQFNAKVKDYRIVDYVSGPCDWAKIGDNKKAQWLGDVASAWSYDEAKDVFKFIGDSTTAYTPKSTGNIRSKIEETINAVLKDSYTQLGRLAVKRSELMIVVNPKVESLLRELNFTCCSAADLTKDPLNDIFKVQSLVAVEYGMLPDGVDFVVYAPRFVLAVTTCAVEPSVSEFSSPQYEPNSTRLFGKELYGFEIVKMPVVTQTKTKGKDASGATVDVFADVVKEEVAFVGHKVAIAAVVVTP